VTLIRGTSSSIASRAAIVSRSLSALPVKAQSKQEVKVALQKDLMMMAFPVLLQAQPKPVWRIALHPAIVLNALPDYIAMPIDKSMPNVDASLFPLVAEYQRKKTEAGCIPLIVKNQENQDCFMVHDNETSSLVPVDGKELPDHPLYALFEEGMYQQFLTGMFNLTLAAFEQQCEMQNNENGTLYMELYTIDDAMTHNFEQVSVRDLMVQQFFKAWTAVLSRYPLKHTKQIVFAFAQDAQAAFEQFKSGQSNNKTLTLTLTMSAEPIECEESSLQGEFRRINLQQDLWPAAYPFISDFDRHYCLSKDLASSQLLGRADIKVDYDFTAFARDLKTVTGTSYGENPLHFLQDDKKDMLIQQLVVLEEARQCAQSKTEHLAGGLLSSYTYSNWLMPDLADARKQKKEAYETFYFLATTTLLTPMALNKIYDPKTRSQIFAARGESGTKAFFQTREGEMLKLVQCGISKNTQPEHQAKKVIYPLWTFHFQQSKPNHPLLLTLEVIFNLLMGKKEFWNGQVTRGENSNEIISVETFQIKKEGNSFKWTTSAGSEAEQAFETPLSIDKVIEICGNAVRPAYEEANNQAALLDKSTLRQTA